MSRIDEKLRDEAAIYLEEMGVSGDAQIGIDAEHAPHKEMIGGAYHIHDLIADYAQSQLQELRGKVEDSKAIIDETIESQKLEYRHVSDWLMGNRNAYNEVMKIIDQLQEEQHNE